MNPKQILILCFPGLGDALMATPMIRRLKQLYPDCSIDVAYMLKSVATVFETNSNIRSLYYLPLYQNKNIAAAFRAALKLRAKKYDLSILPYPAFRREYHLINFLIHAKERITHRYKSGYIKELHFLSTHLIPIYEQKHNTVNNLRLLDAISMNQQSPEESTFFDLKVTQESIEFGLDYLNQLDFDPNHTIAIHPGSTLSPAALLKRWPVENYIKTLRYLLDRNKKIIIFLGNDELDIGKKIIGEIKSSNIKLVENLSLEKAMGVLSLCSGLLANDNGFAHISAALEIPTIVLFAPTPAIWTAPVSKGYLKIIEAKNFKPWFRYELKRKPPKNTLDGMSLISTEEVISELDILFSNASVNIRTR